MMRQRHGRVVTTAIWSPVRLATVWMRMIGFGEGHRR
jgi:hypothetical protein